MLRELLRESPLSDSEVLELEKIIKELTAKYSPISIILAGSIARGKFVHGLSDIDILVVIDRRVKDKERFTLRAVGDIDVEITIINIDELKEAIKRGNQFYKEAIKGIEVYGNLRRHVTQD